MLVRSEQQQRLSGVPSTAIGARGVVAQVEIAAASTTACGTCSTYSATIPSDCIHRTALSTAANHSTQAAIANTATQTTAADSGAQATATNTATQTASAYRTTDSADPTRDPATKSWP